VSSAPRRAAATIDALLRRCTFSPGPATCAVSGGPDSTALLVLAVEAGLDVTAVHVDHGLRPGSAREADLVERVARRWGASFEARTALVADGPNLEARARAARAAMLPPDTLTGHTLDDQAETVLMFLMRGAGPDGLAGIDPWRRPILGLRRAETRALCDELGLDVVSDPSNDDPRFVRNRVRHELLPLMDHIAGRDVAPLVARAAARQRDLLDATAPAATSLDATDARAVAEAPAALAALALRAWWRDVTSEEYAPDSAALGRMLDVARGDAVAADVGGGWRIERTAQRLRLTQISCEGRGNPRPSQKISGSETLARVRP